MRTETKRAIGRAVITAVVLFLLAIPTCFAAKNLVRTVSKLFGH